MANHTTPSSPEQVRISQDVANIKRLKAWRKKLARKRREYESLSDAEKYDGNFFVARDRLNEWHKKHSLGDRADRADIIYPQDMIYPVYDDADICDFCGVLPGHIHKDWCYESSFEHIEKDDMFWGFVISISTLIISAIFVAAAYFISTI